LKANGEYLTRSMPGQLKSFKNLLDQVYWSLCGFDCISTMGGEVENPARTIPVALFSALGIMVCFYVGPLLVGAAVDPEWFCWQSGSISHVAQLVGGDYLGMWVLVSTALSNLGMFSAELLEDSFQLQGMAEIGIAPKCFKYRLPRSGAPIAGITLQVCIVCVLVAFDFEVILCISNAFGAAAFALEIAALIKLRMSHPDMPRPFKIPLSTNWLIAVFAFPFCYAVFMCLLSMCESTTSAILVLSTATAGVLASLQATYGCVPFLGRAEPAALAGKTSSHH